METIKKNKSKLILTAVLVAFFAITGLMVGVHSDPALAGEPVHYVDYIAALVTLPLLTVVLLRVPMYYFAQVAAFCVIAEYCGMMMNFYDLFWWYDLFLHFVSGIVLFSFGQYFYKLICTKAKAALYPPLMLLSAFFFSCACAGFWEMYEFFIDTAFGFDAQGTGVRDTMTDIYAGVCGGAFAMVVLWLVTRRHGKRKKERQQQA